MKAKRALTISPEDANLKDFRALAGCVLFVGRRSLCNPDSKIRFLIATDAYAAWWHAHHKPMGPKRFRKTRVLERGRGV